MSLSDQIVGAESGGDANAQNPNSSAVGAGQFIAPTWLATIKAHRPDLAQGKSDDEILSLRNDPALSKDMVDAYASDNGAILAKNGLPVTPGNTYLAHFAGPQGAVSVLNADPTAPVGSVLGAKVVQSNPFLKDMTVADLRAWADRKMGGTTAAPAGPTAQPPQPATGILSQGGVVPATGAPGILNGQDDGTGAQRAFQAQLANLMGQQQAQPAPTLAPIAMAVPRGLSRAKLLSALQQPLGG